MDSREFARNIAEEQDALRHRRSCSGCGVVLVGVIVVAIILTLLLM